MRALYIVNDVLVFFILNKKACLREGVTERM